MTLTKLSIQELAQRLGGQLMGANPLVKGVSQDSRHVKPGDVFVVIPCDQAQNHAKLALAAGAVALIAEPDFIHQSIDTPMLVVASARRALSQVASLLYPKQPDVMIAVTGTNGKSSVVGFIRQIWSLLGEEETKNAASLGTLGLELTPSASLLSPIEGCKLTTPDALSFHQTLQILAESGVSHCAFEASSHGLDQYRLHGVRLKAAAFTNLTQDHLDYHGDMDTYFAAKAKLFLDILPEDKTAVLNVESAYFPALKALISGRGQKILAYGINHEADIEATNIRLNLDHILVDIRVGDKKWTDVILNLVGNFQIENILCAMGLVMASFESSSRILDKLITILPQLRSAPGRMEMVGKTNEGAAIFIDYAHTPDALSRALRALRNHIPESGRVNVVFGCGGDRDAGKRAQMGAVAQGLADNIFITDDNPRNENPAYIRAQILMACPKAQEISDRRLAMKLAIAQLRPQDVLLIAGKGHEEGQIVGDQIIPFDDREEARSVLGS